MNATASFNGAPVAGTFTYTPPAGTLLNAGQGQTLSVVFTPSNPGFASATATATINVIPTPGAMEGAGQTDAGGLRYEFSFHVRERATGAERGSLRFEVERNGRETRANQVGMFVSTAIAPVVFSDNPALKPGRHSQPVIDTATFSGVGTWKGVAGYSFTAVASDAGEPGRGRDLLAVTVHDPHGVIVAIFNGVISEGNIQSSRVKR